MFQIHTRIVGLTLAVLAAMGVDTRARADFLVSVSNNAGTRNEVLRYTDSGTYVGVFASGGGLNTPEGLSYGPDGNLYVASYGTGAVLKYNGATGAFISTFASDATMTNSVIGLAFGPDKNLYVSNYNAGTASIEKFNGTTGALIGTFVPNGTHGLSGPLDIKFDSSGNLLVSSSGSNQVLKFDTGGNFYQVAASGNGLNFPDGLALKSSNDLFVSSSFGDQILKFSSLGAFQGVFATLAKGSSPIGLLLRPDGHLLVSANGPGTVLDYDASGNLVGTYGLAQMGGAATPGYPTYIIAFVPEPSSVALAGLGGGVLLLGAAWRRRRGAAA